MKKRKGTGYLNFKGQYKEKLKIVTGSMLCSGFIKLTIILCTLDPSLFSMSKQDLTWSYSLDGYTETTCINS